MIKWFSNKIVRWGLKYDEDQKCKEEPSNVVEVGYDLEPSRINMDRSIRFNVLVCQGGVVLEIRTPDSNSGLVKGSYNKDPEIRTHLIPEGEDVAERIGQIVSMEILRA